MLDQLIETWETNNRVNQLLLEKIPGAGMASTLSTRGGRTVSRQWAHMHPQRVRWLEAKGGADLARPLVRFDGRDEPSRQELLEAFRESTAAVATCVREMAGGKRRIKGLKKGFVVAIGYLIAHESHHRGSILLTLKQSGHIIEKATAYRIWDWKRI